MKLITAFSLLVFYLSACHSQEVLETSQQNANQNSDTKTQITNVSNNQTTSKTSDEYGEITNCTPEKFGRSAKLVISLKTPNGGYLAIEREGKNSDYYLLSEPENSNEQKFAAAADSLPFWQVETLKSLNPIELDSSEARAVNLSKLNNKGEGKAELIFSQTGWYKILLSDENFEQDDPVITGQCRVFYDNSTSPQKLMETKNTTGNSVIKWHYTEKNLSFETQLWVKNDQPTAFFIDGSRIIIRGGEESPHDCSFGVDKDKDKNNSVWQTVGNKIVISGKYDSGNDYKMSIEKTGKGFLIDTSAAESCFNVGMPGDILLFRDGNKYTGKFITFAAK